MSLKGHKQVFVCLAGGLLASTALAVSYRDWVALPAPAAAALSILLEPASNGCVEATQSVDQSERGYGRTDSKNRHEVPSRPAGGYLGQMIIRQHPGARLDFPLTVSISFPEVLIEDLLPPVAQRHSISNVATKLLWHQPMGLLNPVSPVRPERFRHSWSITHASPTGSVTLLPLILSRMTAGGFRSGGSANLSSCLCEVRDASGTVLLRKQLVELFCPGNGYGGGGTAWVMNEPEADRFLRESASINNSQTIGALPPLIESYAEINALWISDEATRSATLTRAMLRRLLLMGTWIYGRNMTVSNLTAMAGLSGAGSVLLGGIQGVALPLANNSEAKSHQSHNNENTLWDNYSYINNQNGITNALTVMQNRRDLFQPLKSRYLGWTYSVLGIFFGVACIGLPVAFWRLKSSRRLMLWWLIPLTTVLISGVSLIGGKWLLPRQPQADITEYRFAVAGWPEVFCRSVSRSLTFEERQVSWKMPADHFIFPVRSRSNSKGPEWLDEADGQVVRGIAGLKRGQIVIDESAGFRALPLPVAIDGSTTNLPGLKALAPLRQVHVWENGSWHRAGDLQAGQVINPPFGPMTNKLCGLPERINEAFPAYDLPAPGLCKNCGKVHEVNKNLATAFSNTWIVAALSDEPAATSPLMKGTLSQSRAIWLIQIPMPPKAPAPVDTGDKPR